MDTPRVSVIVPVRNEAGPLERCLASLRAQDFADGALEIVVADGASTDGSAEVAHAAGPQVRVVPNPRRNAAAAMNIGIRAARGDVIIRLDAHAEAAADFVRRSVEALARTGADCVGGPMTTAGEGRVGRAIAAAMTSRFGVGGAAFRVGSDRERDVDTVAFGTYRRGVFARVGGFDETFVRNQDDEFHLRLTRAGGRIVLVPEIRATYRCRDSLGALSRQYIGYGVWKPKILRKHGRLPALRAWAPPLFLLALTASVDAAIVTGEPLWLVAVAGPYAVGVALGSIAAAARGGWDLLPVIAAAFVTMHVSYGMGFWAGLLTRRREGEHARIRRVFAERDERAAGGDGANDAVLRAARDAAFAELLGAWKPLHGGPPRVLDIGCGRGTSLDAFRGEGDRVVGIDLLPSRLAAARTHVPGTELAAADAARLPFRDGAFDLCVLSTVLSSVLDHDVRAAIAAEAMRVLRPGGAALVYEFRFHPWNRDVRGVGVGALRRLFEGASVTHRPVRGPLPLLPTHYAAIVRKPAP